jgi:hypothetical protein
MVLLTFPKEMWDDAKLLSTLAPEGSCVSCCSLAGKHGPVDDDNCARAPVGQKLSTKAHILSLLLLLVFHPFVRAFFCCCFGFLQF